jgi:hypothetical protein
MLHLTPDYKYSYPDEYLSGKNVMFRFGFDGNLSDSSIYGYNLTPAAGSVSFTNAGIVGQALYFDATTWYYVGGSQPSPGAVWNHSNYGTQWNVDNALTNNNWALSFWINTTNQTAIDPILDVLGDSTLATIEVETQPTNGLYVYFDNVTGGSSFFTAGLTWGTKTYADGFWHHIVLSCQSTNIGTNVYIAYLDVTNTATAACQGRTNTCFPPTYQMQIGNDRSGRHPITASYQEMILYNRPFTSNDVFQLNRKIQPR